MLGKAGVGQWTSLARMRSGRSWSLAGSATAISACCCSRTRRRTEAGTILIVAPATLLHPRIPQPAGSLVYQPLTGHPERETGELVFVIDLTCELRAWPTDTWAKVGVDSEKVAQAVIGCWQDGEVTGLQLDDLSFEEARSLAGPAMTYVRGQLRGRLTARIARAHRRWLHPTSGRRSGDQFL
jgi:hypothetical protein